MNMRNLLDNYSEIKECTYKGEHYSVRDNGAVLRHAREGKKKRPNDEIWTFGKPNKHTGYMSICSEQVHRIVAFAFIGEPPTPQHVVDHIDTNRRNNRPQNLRWLTRLENVLNNPITRKKIEYYCGSIEAFVKDPTLIQKLANQDPKFDWMRTVTSEEATAALARLKAWAETESNEKSSGGTMGEWIYKEKLPPYKRGQHQAYPIHRQINNAISVDSHPDSLTASPTPNAMQKHWRTPTVFPLCPAEIGDKPLTAYLNNLKKGAVVTKNQYATHFVDEFALCDNDNCLVITAHTESGQKRYSMTTITFEDGKYVHEGKTFFEERGAQKAITLAQGLEWTGPEGIDDHC